MTYELYINIVVFQKGGYNFCWLHYEVTIMQYSLGSNSLGEG